MTDRLFAVITGGGTGGHVSPALAVAEAMVAAGHDRDEIEFVGARRGIEQHLVPKAGYKLHRLPGRGIQRRLTADNISAVVGLALAVVIAFNLALRRRPRVVVTVGGYAGFAYALAAVVLRIPLVVVNVDAVPGAVNRLLGRFASANAVALPGTAMPRATVTGPPVRQVVLDVPLDDAGRRATRAGLGFDPDRFLVVVTGGSLGAGSINEATLALAGQWPERSDVAIYHVAGERNLAAVSERARAAGLASGPSGLQYRLCGFDPDLVAALGACDVALSRAGANTVAELTALGAPSILVPLPGAPSDHQTRNARALAEAGAAIMIADGELDASSLAKAIDSLAADRDQLAAMSRAARGLGQRDAARKVAALAEESAGRPESRRNR